jgi:hypothetical protein
VRSQSTALPTALVVATLLAVFSTSSSTASAQPAPAQPAPTQPAQPDPTEPAGSTGTGAAGTGAAGTGAAGTGAAGTGAASTTTTPAAPVTAVGDDSDDLSMTFHAKRTQDMQQFADASLQELRIGSVKSRYSLNLFGDFELGARSRSEGNLKPQPAFAIGVFDMLFNADLDQKIFMTSEVAFTYEPNAPLAELERLHMRWKPNKYFFLEAGRFHTDIGYWNVAYHHGKWLQLSIERPRSIALHGGLLPAHWIGAQMGVSVPIAKGQINVVGSVGSARDPVGAGHAAGGHGGAFTPVNGIHGKVEAVGLLLPDLRFGVAGVYDKIRAEEPFTRPALPNESIDEYVGNVFVAYPSVPLILISEGYLIDHTAIGFKWRTYGAFGLVGYQIGRFTPYIKGEYITQKTNAETPDPFYFPEPKSPEPPALARELVEATFGVRADTSTWSSVKVEYRLTRRGDLDLFRPAGDKLPLIHAAVVNWGFGI